MQKVLVSIVVAVGTVIGSHSLSASEISIEVAPNVVSLDSQGEVVTIHTDIGFSAVVGHSVTLTQDDETIEIQSWKSDNRGYFVAKFDLDEVKGILEVGTVTLTLGGVTTGGEEFTGSDTIRVIKPRGK